MKKNEYTHTLYDQVYVYAVPNKQMTLDIFSFQRLGILVIHLMEAQSRLQLHIKASNRFRTKNLI